MMNSFDELHVYNRDGIYYFVRRIPADLRQFYSASRISFSLKTKSLGTALRHAKSVRQKLEDYWLGLRLQRIDIPQIKVSTENVYRLGNGCSFHVRFVRPLTLYLLSLLFNHQA